MHEYLVNIEISIFLLHNDEETLKRPRRKDLSVNSIRDVNWFNIKLQWSLTYLTPLS